MGMDQYILLESEDKDSGEKKETDICCWRKYFRLHNFVFGELEGKELRFEDGIYITELTVEQLDTIRRFVLDIGEFAEKDYYGNDLYQTMSEEVMSELKNEWDAALTKCIEKVKKSKESKDSPQLRIIYSSSW